jgi:hypothetical protein
MGGRKKEIGGGRPGMTDVVRTTDGKWLLPYEYWVGGANTRFRIADDPLTFFTNSPTGESVASLDANIGNGDVPDVVLEEPGAASNPDTRYWHVVSEPRGGTTPLNTSGGRAAAIRTGDATAGRRIGQWVDDSATGSWNLVTTEDGFYRLQSLRNPNPYLTGASDGAPLTSQNVVADGSQERELVQWAPPRDS